MFRIISILFLIACKSFAANNDGIYIKLGEASTKRVDLALIIPSCKNDNNSSEMTDPTQNEISKVVFDDLKVSSMFNIFTNPNQNKKAEIRLEVECTLHKDQINLEVSGYKKSALLAFYNEKFQEPLKATRRLAHTVSNHFLENLTGKAGPFLSRIVVSTDRANNPSREIFTMDWDGENPFQVTKFRNLARSPNWSWDGNFIAYTIMVKIDNGFHKNPALILYNVATNRHHMIANRRGNNSGPSFTPDGKSIYMTSSFEGNYDIYKISSETGAIQEKITKGPFSAMNIESAVSPNGSQIAFSSDRSRKTSLYLMNSDGTGAKRLTNFKEFANAPAWSPDGTKIAFAAQDNSNFDIFVIDTNGSNLKRITEGKRKPNGRLAHNEYPSFSPDGRFIMYTSDRSGKNQIYISTIDGNNEYQITNDEFNYFSPKWSWINK